MADAPLKNRRKPSQPLPSAPETGNTPPQALDVEEAVLGAMLVLPSVQDQAIEELTPSCFYSEHNRMIFEAMASLNNERVSIDLITVTERLRQQGNLETIGGPVVLSGMSMKVGAAVNIEYYIKILRQKSIQRELIEASYTILKYSYDDSANVDDLVDLAQSKIFDAINQNVKREVQTVGSLLNDAIAEIQRKQETSGLSGVPSGFTSLDQVTMGWQKSDLVILAARPSVGKTAFALNVARNAAVDHGIPVAVFSLEMSSLQLVMRLMTTETGLPADKIKGGSKLEDYEWEQLEYRIKSLSKAPLYIDDTPSLPIMEFRNKAKMLVNQKGVRLIVVDYLQLMQGPPDLRGMREQEVAFISRTLKATAKELNIPIIALSQLSRNAVQRGGSIGKPMLSDLRESGAIEQDADIVIFIHRPDFVGLSDNNEDKEKTWIILAKHRNGETGDIPMLFKSDRVKFVEMDQALDIQAAGMSYESGMNSDASFEDNPAF